MILTKKTFLTLALFTLILGGIKSALYIIKTICLISVKIKNIFITKICRYQKVYHSRPN